jgi:hypothetical protein
MAIIGDGFNEYVKKQIDRRQLALGEYNRQLKNTKAFMTRTPWVRMVSSVNITEGDLALPGDAVLDTLLKSGNYSETDLSGDNLAKNFILFNGISNEKGGITNLYSGITGGPSSKLFGGGAYGFGSRDDIQTERGFVPMPGITNVNFQYKNDGALAMATVQIKAFNRSQFQLIDILFQRPGYTVLLEFGSTVYLDNDGNLVEASYDTLPFQHMFKTDQDMFTLHEVIAKEKIKWNGNYEGFFAKITKWNWKFNADGSYDITVSLIGMGDVIDSLKINVAIDKKSAEIIDKETTGLFVSNAENPIVASAKSSRLNYALWDIYQNIKNTTLNTKKNVKVFNYVSIEKDENGIVTKINPPSVFQVNFGALTISGATVDEESKYDPQTYITLGTLLALITSNLSISGKNGEKITPYILFDMNLENYLLDDNYIATFPGNFSSDPNICLIPYQPISPDITKPFRLPDTTVNKILKQSDFFTVDDNSLIGRMMNIYINIGFIIKTFNSSINENDEVILIEFLKNVLSGVNNSLGGLNDFRIIHNKDTNLFEIRSEVNLNIKPKSLPHTINTFGVPKDNGSFVREVDFNSELTNKYATMLSIGAQADGNISQNNSTAFSIYNKGLVDRVIKEKVDTTRTSEDDKKNKIEDLFTKDIEKCFEEVYNFKKFTNDNTSVLSNINSQYCKLASGKLTQIKKSSAPFFLPFNLSLTMDGLSGMKIYQSFKVDGKALPLTYDTNVIQLIITSLSHDVSPNGWLTKLETIAGPIFDVLPNITKGSYGESSTPETTNPTPDNPSSTTPSSTTPPPPSLDPTSTSRFLAMQKSYNAVYRDQSQEDSMCGRWVYNLAYNYVKALRGDNKIAGKQITGKGHAREELLRSSLSKLGYTVTKVGNNIPKQQLRSLISSTTWGYGDIAIYCANDGAGSHRRYGHIQIYIGNISGVPSTSKTKLNSGWATSVSNNYGSPFVYGDRNSNKWDFYVLRAPSK